ncbi:MAG: acyl-CoA dehydrogenase family protein, partial [Candidatus Syntropharchaeia archaeon]
MNFDLTEEQKMIKKMVREFAEKELAPKAKEIDESGEYPWENIRKAAEQNLMGVPFPVEYGGAGADMVSYAIVVEELSRACATTGLICYVNSMCAFPIHLRGTEEQKKKYLTPLCQGKKIGTLCITEPDVGSDVASTKTTAVLDGDEYVLNGRKSLITNAGVADIYAVLANTGGRRHENLSMFIVEKGEEGFSFGKNVEKMGLKASVLGDLIFEDCRIPKENLIGNEGEGFKIAMM